ncbi:MAG: response regulator transcription factor [Thermanaerothrix sp.]|jgi:two-component system nitrate/nitrite response regulator NarL|uniref:LuxR C-terminal-related transcriptional regulator n=1 Tax=Thermanaerothrix solaris TaxID=3058434 RepID=A0ABU3NLR7_9CHLR|nr:LuxR C-terminal-related transcriptional regulator [Thermanaerothrix sp. 4228-RoL]MDT8897153.1 LuxR C-terminal-related transcriptional regulator [Thermanaerothrix sp. 4228-RoL]
MTRVLWLAHENAIFTFDVALNPSDLLLAVNGGDWRPPAAIFALLSPEVQALQKPLRGVLLGHLVVVYPLALVESEDAYQSMPHVQLSERQRLVLQGLAEGLSLKIIARRLGISQSTVAAHVRALKQRLNCHTLAEIILRGSALGLCDPEQSLPSLYKPRLKHAKTANLRSRLSRR